jgi:hypothetical protein
MPRYFEFELAVREITPRIWRRVLLPVDASFQQLHQAIQDGSGSWVDYHLHAFRPDHRSDEDLCGTPDEDDPDRRVRDSKRVRLDSWFDPGVAGGKQKCLYNYDFGDDWEVDVAILGVMELPETFKRRLIGGARRFPPEDCGGPLGYEQCVRVAEWAQRKRKREPGMTEEEALERLEWLGQWRPDNWDFNEVRIDFDKPARRQWRKVSPA